MGRKREIGSAYQPDDGNGASAQNTINWFAEGLGRNICEIRTRRGLTQVELAKKLYVSSTTVSRIEHGEVGLGCEEVNKICAALNCKLAEIWPDRSMIAKEPEIPVVRVILMNPDQCDADAVDGLSAEKDK